MTDVIAIHPSQKAGLVSREKYIVTFGNYVCLRILSVGTRYAVVTATADEDGKQFQAPENQVLLIELGERTGEILEVKPALFSDNAGRGYVGICEIENEEDAFRVVHVFMGLLKEEIQAYEFNQAAIREESEARRELRDIYTAIAPGNSEEDAYLGDGVWISREGDWSDRGR